MARVSAGVAGLGTGFTASMPAPMAQPRGPMAERAGVATGVVLLGASALPGTLRGIEPVGRTAGRSREDLALGLSGGAEALVPRRPPALPLHVLSCHRHGQCWRWRTP